MALIITAIITGLIALWCFFIAVRQHMEKGMVFTNAWIYASKAERAQMDYRKKRLEHRLARNVFFIIGIIFLVMTLYVIFSLPFLLCIIFGLSGATCILAIVQTVLNVRIYKRLGIK